VSCLQNKSICCARNCASSSSRGTLDPNCGMNTTPTNPRTGHGAVPCVGSMAACGLDFTMCSGTPPHGARQPIAGRPRAILARPVVLQTGPARGVVAWHQDYSYWTALSPWRISRVGSVWTTVRSTTAVCNTCREVTVGPPAHHGAGGEHGGHSGSPDGGTVAGLSRAGAIELKKGECSFIIAAGSRFV